MLSGFIFLFLQFFLIKLVSTGYKSCTYGKLARSIQNRKKPGALDTQANRNRESGVDPAGRAFPKSPRPCLSSIFCLFDLSPGKGEEMAATQTKIKLKIGTRALIIFIIITLSGIMAHFAG